MTVFENVAFGLRVRRGEKRVGEDEIRTRVGKLLDLVQLGWLAHRYPSQLSGGQRQRIALARALAIDPQVLLLDEPFGALDAKVRKELRRWLRELHENIHVTSVFVTHDQEEALELADRVVVMDGGRIEQIGTPEDVYERPATAFVHEFIGESVVLPITVTDGVARHGGEPVGLDSQGLRSGTGKLLPTRRWRAGSPVSTASARRGGSRSRCARRTAPWSRSTCRARASSHPARRLGCVRGHTGFSQLPRNRCAVPILKTSYISPYATSASARGLSTAAPCSILVVIAAEWPIQPRDGGAGGRAYRADRDLDALRNGGAPQSGVRHGPRRRE
jgi:energy-coupling factor transporter ATP-binding protein EcfA2